MSKISIQVRFYNSDLSFRRTLEFSDATIAHIEAGMHMIFLEKTAKVSQVEGRLPTNLCNMMIRENGKLVSYRKFFK
ncbi:MAG: hypothetical protein ACRDC4_00865 [Plesiomonas sp.]